MGLFSHVQFLWVIPEDINEIKTVCFCFLIHGASINFVIFFKITKVGDSYVEFWIFSKKYGSVSQLTIIRLNSSILPDAGRMILFLWEEMCDEETFG